jgi:hypothetical protein
MTMKDATRIAGFAMAAALMLAGPGFAQQRAPSVFTVSNVKAEAEAANAVDAKKLATEAAETRAFRRLISRLGDLRSQSRIHDLQTAQLERLISDIEVRNEGVSQTSYVATFGITFSERNVLALLGQYGVKPVLDRGPEILIVPVYIEDGAARTTDRNPWRSALAGLDLTHALLPAKVAPARGDITAGIANAYAGNPAASIETLKSQYGATQLLLAVAEVDGGGDALTLKLAGSDAVGLFSLQRKLKSGDGVDESLVQDAARLAFETVQQRWKLTRERATQAAYRAPAASDDAPPSYASRGGDAASIQVTAEFSGLREWQTIRQRLQSIPGVQNWDLRSVNPRSAEIGLDFPGGAERLAEMAASQGLSVENGPDGLVVKTR